jgi:hypothetical protein
MGIEVAATVFLLLKLVLVGPAAFFIACRQDPEAPGTGASPATNLVYFSVLVHPNHRDGPCCVCRLPADGVMVNDGGVVRSLMSAIAAHSCASRMPATAAFLSLYFPDTASTFPVRESNLNSKSPPVVTTSSNVPVMVEMILESGASSVPARAIRAIT